MAKRKALKLKVDEFGRVPFSESDLYHPDFDKAAFEALGLDFDEVMAKALEEAKTAPRKRLTGREFDGGNFPGIRYDPKVGF
jgi:hypothetical protein